VPPSVDVGEKKLILNWEDLTKDLEIERRVLAFSRCWRAIKAEEGKVK
jgi:hypothetical protein